MSLRLCVLQQKSRISAQRREELVREKAWWLFLKREPSRTKDDWHKAHFPFGMGFAYMSPSDSRWPQFVAKAEEIWLGRKDADTLQDWRDAEVEVDREYEVV